MAVISTSSPVGKVSLEFKKLKGRSIFIQFQMSSASQQK